MVSLTWEYPETMPTNWQPYIFKKQDVPVSDELIADYFAGSVTDQQLADNNVFVFRDLPKNNLNFKKVNDFRVFNDRLFQYRATIRDLDSSTEHSVAQDVSATPVANIAIFVVDGKELVARAIEKMFDTMKSVQGNKLTLASNISVFKSHARRKEEDCFVVVQRSAGQLAERTLDNNIAEFQSDILKGEVDADVMQVEWISIGDPERRDKITNIMRIMRQAIRYFIIQMGNGAVRDVRFIMSGDAEGQYAGAEGVRGQMTVILIVEQYLQLNNPNLGVIEAFSNTYVGV